MNARVALLAVLALLVAAACAGNAFPEPGEPHRLAAAQRWPGTALEELQQGRALYLGRCGSCHRPFEPGAVAAANWRKEIAEMQAQAKLSDAQAEAIAKYLITVSEQAR